MDERSCKYISSRGFLKSCNVHSIEPISDGRYVFGYDFSKAVEGCSIYIPTSCIPQFKNMINVIKCKFILVSGDSDLECPSSIFNSHESFLKFIENDKIIHWYSQNCITNHPKLTKLPIGLDYHTISTNVNHSWGKQISPYEQEKEIELIIEKSKPFWERIPICYSNFHFATYPRHGNPRKRAIETIQTDCIVYEKTPLPRINTLEEQIKYSFVVSPHGNGLDCHRTWEALILGCIVIVEKSEIDELYEGLPVLIIDDYKNITHELLENTIKEFKNKKFNYEKLLLSYWINKINKIK